MFASRPWLRPVVIGCILLALFSFVRIVTDQPKLTAGATLHHRRRAWPPRSCWPASAGCTPSGAGIVNIGLEGMMVMGTWFAGYAGWQYGPWYALAFGAFGGMLGGIIHAVATVTFGVDQIVSGIAINLIAPGVARFLSSEIFVGQGDGTITQSPSITGEHRALLRSRCSRRSSSG